MKFASWSAIFCHTNFCKLLSFCMPQFPHQQKTYDDNINHVGLFLGLSEKICIKHLAHEIFSINMLYYYYGEGMKMQN